MSDVGGGIRGIQSSSRITGTSEVQSKIKPSALNVTFIWDEVSACKSAYKNFGLRASLMGTSAALLNIMNWACAQVTRS